jgi:oxygen-independent coproporphyrinogen-3 oxidase
MKESAPMIKGEPATTIGVPTETDVGSVFVSNYPPYSFWTDKALPAARLAMETPPAGTADLGLYVHIPFCRKRCKFCYFRVYTDKNSSDIESYLDGLVREVELVADKPAIAGRPLKFVYFGGGTPSYLSARQLESLVRRLEALIPWAGAEEVTFECEPGTLKRSRLESIREIGVTRLSLGIENFDDAILAGNGRAHVSEEIFEVLPWIRALDFDQLNVDLISGMVGETWETWRETVRKTVETDADSVTIYQMELPYNTVYSRDLLAGAGPPVADWATKREWHDHAIEQLSAAGYVISSAYTMVKKDRPGRFVYRDAVWHGADLLGTGVSSFSHLGGVHYQNESSWGGYLNRVQAGQLPIERGFATTVRERLTRELILQLKLGHVHADYFRRKFGAEILEEFAGALGALQAEHMVEVHGEEVRLTRQGLLRVDQLLPQFYAPQYRDARYT